MSVNSKTPNSHKQSPKQDHAQAARSLFDTMSAPKRNTFSKDLELSPDSRELLQDLEETEQQLLKHSHSISPVQHVEANDTPLMQRQNNNDPKPNQRLAFSAVRTTEAVEEKSGDELMDESERLARQLMEEEQNLLCERIQQEQMRIIVQMRNNSTAQANSDLGIAIRLAEEGETEEQGGIDPDDMSYDELLELGEQIGNVKQERWRIEGKEAVAALRIVTYQMPAQTSKGQVKYPDGLKMLDDDPEPTCLVCQHSYVTNDKLKVLPCDHVFHVNCIDVWLKDHDTCVTCKRSIKDEAK